MGTIGSTFRRKKENSEGASGIDTDESEGENDYEPATEYKSFEFETTVLPKYYANYCEDFK